MNFETTKNQKRTNILSKLLLSQQIFILSAAVNVANGICLVVEVDRIFFDLVYIRGAYAVLFAFYIAWTRVVEGTCSIEDS